MQSEQREKENTYGCLQVVKVGFSGGGHMPLVSWEIRVLKQAAGSCTVPVPYPEAVPDSLSLFLGRSELGVDCLAAWGPECRQ